jgi:hypothetical protein
VPRLHKESIVRWELFRQLEASSARELQLKCANQGGQKPLDKEAEDATSLEAATKQRSEDRDWERQSVRGSDF